MQFAVCVSGGAPGRARTIDRRRGAAGGELAMNAKRLLDRQFQVHPIALGDAEVALRLALPLATLDEERRVAADGLEVRRLGR